MEALRDHPLAEEGRLSEFLVLDHHRLGDRLAFPVQQIAGGEGAHLGVVVEIGLPESLLQTYRGDEGRSRGGDVIIVDHRGRAVERLQRQAQRRLEQLRLHGGVVDRLYGPGQTSQRRLHRPAAPDRPSENIVLASSRCQAQVSTASISRSQT